MSGVVSRFRGSFSSKTAGREESLQKFIEGYTKEKSAEVFDLFRSYGDGTSLTKKQFYEVLQLLRIAFTHEEFRKLCKVLEPRSSVDEIKRSAFDSWLRDRQKMLNESAGGAAAAPRVERDVVDITRPEMAHHNAAPALKSKALFATPPASPVAGSTTAGAGAPASPVAGGSGAGGSSPLHNAADTEAVVSMLGASPTKATIRQRFIEIGLEEPQKKKLHRLFHHHDQRGSGGIDAAAVRHLMNATDLGLTVADTELFVSDLVLDPRGEISYRSILSALDRLRQKMKTEENTKALMQIGDDPESLAALSLFQICDTDDDGVITEAELRAGMRQLDVAIKEAEFSVLLNSVNPSASSSRIRRDAFVRGFKHFQSVLRGSKAAGREPAVASHYTSLSREELLQELIKARTEADLGLAVIDDQNKEISALKKNAWDNEKDTELMERCQEIIEQQDNTIAALTNQLAEVMTQLEDLQEKMRKK